MVTKRSFRQINTKKLEISFETDFFFIYIKNFRGFFYLDARFSDTAAKVTPSWTPEGVVLRFIRSCFPTNQWRLRSARDSTLSAQSLRCPHEKTLCPLLPTERTAKTDQTGKIPRLIWVFAGHRGYFVGFVMLRLKNMPRHEKTCLFHMRTTKLQISLLIRGVWSTPLFFAAWIVHYLFWL